MSAIEDFNAYRQKMNDRILSEDNRVLKRFFNLDTQVYQEEALSAQTKELLGLVASLVLRCDDCVRYHLLQCHKAGINAKQVMETMSVGLVVGGSIVIPHLRRGVEFWDELVAENDRHGDADD